MSDTRGQSEIAHGAMLASGQTESLWGWGSPAGRVRAERRARLILDRAQLTSGKKVIEIGCGTGMFSCYFAESGAEILAVDISPDLIEKARQERTRTNITYDCVRFEECDARGPFDVVLGSSVLHHLDLDRALPRIFGLLKPGGRFVFAEPNLLNPQVWCERRFRRFFPYVSPDETAFVRLSFGRLLRAKGFVDVYIVPFDWLHPSVPRPLIGVCSFLGGVLEAFPLVREFSGSLLISARKPL